MTKQAIVAPVKVDTIIKTVIIHDTIPKLSVGESKVWTLGKAGIHAGIRQETAIHYDIRKPNYVIIHHTSQNSIDQTIRTFQIEHTKVSSHYVIGRDGTTIQMLNDYVRSWHAGVSKWGTLTDMNSISIGIELDNNGEEAFPQVQIEALMVLLDTLKTNYGIPTANFIGHGDVAPARKNDPSSYFPWKQLADRGFGIWYNPGELVTPPDNFNAIDALKIIGYDTSNLKAAIIAFKRKFIINDVSPTLTPYDKSILYNLYQKY
ncbi:N-acetylmuramoyl-L-alanine amidase [Sphingobacterium sp. SRCM116780]|uniref:N-acetylmuramoyl-L-alanine amidase n=1 Tax=Sphingobacterium sp. SRCM116780 TaxID=2907623 RepID=UPI001F20020A|nr:N-acetylmuramoyl-L-alanine amidase [Sphingobacterium sp. SRCM116780]UIR55772.1 N-acetylmuramoyl-L-alanine amidase [Sphingobacterium sp. SRCM116780]